MNIHITLANVLDYVIFSFYLELQIEDEQKRIIIYNAAMR